MSTTGADRGRVTIFAEDLDDKTMEEAIRICSNAFDNPPASGQMYGELSRKIRNELDKATGHRGWNCVVGRSFGAFLTQKIKCFAYFSVFPGVNILIWKA